MSNRIESAMHKEGFTQTSLAEKLKVTPQAVQKWVSGETHPKGSRLKLLASILKADVNWLITGEGEEHNNRRLEDLSNTHKTFRLGEFGLIPVVGTTQLGDNGHWYELEYPVGHGDGYIAYPSRDKSAYALRCVGDSMKPRIRDGEFVIVEPNREAQPGDDVVLKSLSGCVMAKTFLYKRDGKIHLQSINEAHPSIALLLEDVDKVHPIAAIVNNALWVKDGD